MKITRLIPFIILFALISLLWRELCYSKPNELPSALIGEDIPAFKLPDLFLPHHFFTKKDLLGHVALLNVWATWCYACHIEHPMLMKIRQQYHVPIYSVDYKDTDTDAKTWLQKNGNPYVIVGNDAKGNVAIDLGVYGTPETFVINAHGKIIYRHIGVIDEKTWNEVLYPLVKKWSGVQ